MDDGTTSTSVDRKKNELREQIKAEIAEYEFTDGIEDIDEFIGDVVDGAFDIDSPSYPIECVTLGKDSGSSVKPGNIKFQPLNIIQMAAEGALAVGAASAMPVLAPAAAVAVWASVWKGLSIDLTTEESFIYGVIVKNQNAHGLTPANEINDLVFQEIENTGLDLVIDETVIESAVARLKRVDALDDPEIDGTVYYHGREFFKKKWV